MGYIRKALSEHPGSACCTDDIFEIFVLFGRCLCCLLPSFAGQCVPCFHGAWPDAPTYRHFSKVFWDYRDAFFHAESIGAGPILQLNDMSEKLPLYCQKCIFYSMFVLDVTSVAVDVGAVNEEYL